MIEELLIAAGLMSGDKYRISFVSEPFCRCVQGNLTEKMLAGAVRAMGEARAIDTSVDVLDSNLRVSAVRIGLYDGGYSVQPAGVRIELEMRRSAQNYCATLEYDSLNSPNVVLAALTIEKK